MGWTPELESTWEPITALVKQFPDFDLEDKVNILRWSIDKLKIPMDAEKEKLRRGERKKKPNQKYLVKEIVGG